MVDTAQTLAELLGMWGHQTRVAFDGAKALETARTWHPDVILLDLGMPGMDGYETARRLRTEYGKDSMSIILSSFAVFFPDALQTNNHPLAFHLAAGRIII